jgi:hypothetical protein
MPTLLFEKRFLDDFTSLEPPVRQKVRELPAKFEEAVHTGVHLERINGARDERVRTVRVDQFWRGVVVHLGEGRYALLRVMPHDHANRWAMNQQFAVNPVTGIIELIDIPAVEERAGITTVLDAPGAPGLFEAVDDTTLGRLGITPELVPVIRRLHTDAELLALSDLLPPAQADALLMLADGQTAEEVWGQLVADYDLGGAPVDIEDIDAAAEKPANRANFVVTTTDSDLMELLTGSFEAWRTFLHPTQRALAERPEYSGPARVTGGAGTGKTVVAIHRARFLARQLVTTGSESRVLFATYTKSLAANLERTLQGFCEPEESRRIHVVTVDALARQVLSGTDVKIRPASSDELRDLADDAAAVAGLDELGLSGRFLRTEWEQVVVARGLGSLAEYANSPRPGRGRPLNRKARIAVWAGIEHLTAELDRRRTATYSQLAERAAQILTARAVSPYAHVIVDEAQDLHPAQWRLLRAAVRPGVNDMFIAGDAHQRIYDNRVSLVSLGIETRGRSRRLKINYRTSRQILAWALSILTGEPVDDLDGGEERQAGYRSALDGPPPRLERFVTPAEQAEFIAQQVKAWLDGGESPGAVGVVARTHRHLDSINAALNSAGVPSAAATGAADAGKVFVDTMHGSKGLEFTRLIVASVDRDAIPLPASVTPEAEDPQQHALDLMRERSLLYVACTRARDELVVTGSGPASPMLPSLNPAAGEAQ